MTDLLTGATDARQTKEWGEFLSQIGWTVETVEDKYIFIRKVPLFSVAFIKIQHPKGKIHFKKIDTLARRYRTLFTIIEPHVAGFNESDFLHHGYSVSKLRYAHSATILIDLRKSPEDLWKSFSENARRNIRKAEKNLLITPVTLGKKTDETEIKAFYSLYAELGKRKRFYVPSFHETHAKMRAFRRTSVLLWAFERNEEKPVAVLWVGSVGNTLVYFHPGNTERGYELLANYLLVWEAMKWGKKRGLNYFDFETAYDPRYPFENKEWQGYTEFKKKFGGEYVQFPPSYIKFYNPVMKWFYLIGTMFSK